jgi:hypothetical protein
MAGIVMRALREVIKPELLVPESTFPIPKLAKVTFFFSCVTPPSLLLFFELTQKKKFVETEELLILAPRGVTSQDFLAAA